MTPGILPFALRAGLRPFKFAPGEFVERVRIVAESAFLPIVSVEAF